MPMSIVPRVSITQTVIAEADLEKEQDERTQKDTSQQNETPRQLRQANSRLLDRSFDGDDNVLCDSMQISVPKHLDSPQISITTVNHSDD